MNKRIAALAAACFAALVFGSSAQAADPTPLCTPIYNSTTGAKSCVEVGQTGPGGPINPLPVTNSGGGGLASNVTQWASQTLGAITNYGTSPGAVLVPAFNAFVTNTITATVTGVATAANQATEIASLATIATNTGAAVPAGTNIIGKVGIDQTTPGTTNGVQINAPIAAGTNLIGGVRAFTSNNADYRPEVCANHVFKHITTATDTQIVAQNGAMNIYICDYSFSFNGTGNLFLEKATSGTCATLTQIDQTWYGAANVGKIAANPYYEGLNTGPSAQLCVNTSAAVSVDIAVNYDQY